MNPPPPRIQPLSGKPKRTGRGAVSCVQVHEVDPVRYVGSRGIGAIPDRFVPAGLQVPGCENPYGPSCGIAYPDPGHPGTRQSISYARLTGNRVRRNPKCGLSCRGRLASALLFVSLFSARHKVRLEPVGKRHRRSIRASDQGKGGTLPIFTRLRFWCRDVIFRGVSQLISGSQSCGPLTAHRFPLTARSKLLARHAGCRLVRAVVT